MILIITNIFLKINFELKMGCIDDSFENELKLKSKEKRKHLKIELRDEIIQFIISNPFYEVHVKEFRKFLKSLKTEKEENKITKDYIMNGIIDTYFQKQKDINLYIFKTVINYSFNRFNSIFRDMDEEVIIIINTIIFLFLTKRQKGIKKEMEKDLCKLFDNIRLDLKVNDDEYKYKFKSGKFSFLIINLIQLCSFCFLNFFCGPATLIKIANYGIKDLNTIFSENHKTKIYEPENINKVVKNSLVYIDELIQPKLINNKILTLVLQPLGKYISENKEEETFWIDSDKLIKILELLIDKMDYEYYIDLFFNDEEEQ